MVVHVHQTLLTWSQLTSERPIVEAGSDRNLSSLITWIRQSLAYLYKFNKYLLKFYYILEYDVTWYEKIQMSLRNYAYSTEMNNLVALSLDLSYYCAFSVLKKNDWEFPGGWRVRIWAFTAVAWGSVPYQGTEILQVAQHGQKNKTRMNHIEKK